MASKSVSREERAATIVEEGIVVELEAEAGLFVVVDRANNRKAHLSSTDFCDCKDHEHRGVACAHILAVRKALNLIVCPQCSEPIEARQFYIGGREYVYFDVCSGDGSHFSRERGGL